MFAETKIRTTIEKPQVSCQTFPLSEGILLLFQAVNVNKLAQAPVNKNKKAEAGKSPFAYSLVHS